MNPQPPRAQPKTLASRASAASRLVLAVSVALLVVGCGNRGSLYLPEVDEPATSPPVSHSAPAAPEEEDDGEDDEEDDAATRGS